MKENSESPCNTCKRIDTCRNIECYKWRIWFKKEWRKIRADLGIEE